MADNHGIAALWPVVAVILLLGVTNLKKIRKRAPLPPGPKGWFFVGTPSALPAEQPWVHAAKYKDVYGPLVFFKIFGKKFLILNSAAAAEGLLNKHSKVNSDRPYTYMSDKYVSLP